MSLPNNDQTNAEATQNSKSQSKKKLLPLSSSNGGNRQTLIRSPCSPLSASKQVVESEIENRVPVNDNIVPAETPQESQRGTPTKSEASGDVTSKEGSGYRRSSSVNMKKMKQMFENAAEENVRSIRSYVTELKERVAKLQYQKHLLVCQVLELETNEAAGCNIDENEEDFEANEPEVSWHLTFREQRQQIIELWDACFVSIIHRSQFYLLFKGDPEDQIYMEVELRRLTWLQQHLSENGNATPGRDEHAISLSSSIKALRREREFLARRVSSRLSSEEREAYYAKWGVEVEGKHRRLQFVSKLWRDPHDPLHVHESAEIVAKLVGFGEGGKASREMFELNFALPTDKRPWVAGWNHISDLLHL